MPVVFLSSWAASSPMWEYQMLPLSERGLRCIAYDRRGHGRSDDPGRGYDFDTLADDLAELLTQLDLRGVTLVGHSMGCAEIARYLSRHGTSRIARAVLIGTTTPFLLQTPDNPAGVPKHLFEANTAILLADRQRYFASGMIKFFGLGRSWPAPENVSPEVMQWALRLTDECSPKAILACRRAIDETDFRSDLRAFTIPTLILHGDNDQSTPLQRCGRRTAQAIPHSQLNVYEGAAHGLFLTHKERVNDDLLAFIQG
ncbi:alpha/beta fold hydrolase [Ktedonobacter sp. SOSP1-85]|uniref:alpha/beta fold hydrolase n=1 Tax=Ktedonobacter sp. SOSP1-85 TaxID=2778367 RepID=UPI001F408B4D|nr:alpha/beta hydrolase [Ktedonobacter sp. SOSP1-85]